MKNLGTSRICIQFNLMLKKTWLPWTNNTVFLQPLNTFSEISQLHWVKSYFRMAIEPHICPKHGQCMYHLNPCVANNETSKYQTKHEPPPQTYPFLPKSTHVRWFQSHNVFPLYVSLTTTDFNGSCWKNAPPSDPSISMIRTPHGQS